MNQEFFESVWIECNLIGHTSRNKQLMNLYYNPIESFFKVFLEELSTNIYFAIVENKPITHTHG